MASSVEIFAVNKQPDSEIVVSKTERQKKPCVDPIIERVIIIQSRRTVSTIENDELNQLLL